MNKMIADEIRPTDFSDIVGQEHLFGERGVLRRMTEAGRITNMIFYGPPGTGKTTAANIIAAKSGMTLYKLNATTASLQDVKDIASQTSNMFGFGGILLYLDEIQYFNRKQQQSLLEYIEDGRITLIASTTENPHFYVYNALISRSSLFEFKPVAPASVARALERTLRILNEKNGSAKTCDREILEYIGKCAGGDVRRSIGMLEGAFYAAEDTITREEIDSFIPSTLGNYDEDAHFDLMSCLQKSIRGSDPDAAVFYLAKLLSAGELIAACRRLQVIASEDIGAAYPMAASIVRACCESAKELGMPEAAIPLSNAAVLLATSPKSNSSYMAYHAALSDIEAGKGREIPEHLRSPLFKGYKYPHDYPHHYVAQQYLPPDLANKTYYVYGENKTEQSAKAYNDMIKGKN